MFSMHDIKRNSWRATGIVTLALLLTLAGLVISGGTHIVHAQDGGGWSLDMEVNGGKAKPDDPNVALGSMLSVGCWGNYANQYGSRSEKPSAGDKNAHKWGRIDSSGNMAGGCQFKGGDTNTTLYAGSLRGTFDPSSGAISNFHIETTETDTLSTYVATYTMDGSGGPLNPPNLSYTHQVTGKFTATYDDLKDTYGGVYDKTVTGTFTLKLIIRPIGSSIQLDRAEAARFSALRLTGSGFKKGDNLKIMFNGQEIYQVDVMADGNIPKDIWIWVPDDAAFGVNKVWAEVKGKDTKSNTVELNIKALGRDQLVSNFDEVTKQYLATIPRNERWYAFTRSGAVRNIGNAVGPIGAPVVWLVTTVFTLGTYRADLWPDNEFVCSDYQAKTLAFLDAMRFDPDPKRRAFLDGLDYGPFNSGNPVDTPAGSHFFVVVWPHAAALDLAMVAAGFPSTWQTAGMAFDPWPKQAPEIFEIKSGTGDWAESSIYSSRWKIGAQHSYLFARPEPPNFGYNKDAYPITGAKYYDPKGRGKLAADYRSIVGIGGNEPPKMLSVHSPVTLEFTDALGHKAGMKADGTLYDDIPDAEIMVVEKPEGGYEWYVALPEGKIDVTATGTADGSYQLVTKNRNQPIYEYPVVPVTAGAASQLTLDDQPNPQSLHTPDGKTLLPAQLAKQAQKDAPVGNPLASGATSNSLLLVGAGIAVCGLAAAFLAVVGLLFWRRRRPQPAVAWVPAARPPQAVVNPVPWPGNRQAASPAAAWLVITSPIGSFPPLNIPPSGLTIGRTSLNQLAINDVEISRRHACIQFANGAWVVTDLGSANGTLVNGVRVQRQALKHGDQIAIGKTTMTFQVMS